MHLSADVKQLFGEIKEQVTGFFTIPFMRLGNDADIRVHRIHRQKDLWVPMRDGVRLCADLYVPEGETPTETIIIRMPYGKRHPYCWMPAIGRFWAHRGYTCLIQDVRGRFASEGEFIPFVNEINDGYDTIEWITSRDWNNGAVGIMGESYYGYTSWAAAVSGHPALKCAAPSTTSMDIYNNWVYNNGAFCLQTMGIWGITMDSRTYTNEYRLDLDHLPIREIDAKAGIPSRIYREWMGHPYRDDYWRRINLDHLASSVKIPCLHIGGWYDVFLRSTYEDWKRVTEQAGTEEARKRQWLLLGPNDHEFSTDFTPKAGRVELGNAAMQKRWEVLPRFFDRFLKGIDNGFDNSPKVEYFIIGKNTWETADFWPPPGTEEALFYLEAGGRLSPGTEVGMRQSAGTEVAGEPLDYDEYIYDPTDPVRSSEDIDLWYFAEELEDRRALEERKDVLVYSTDPLETEMIAAGPVAVKLYASSDRRDTDFTAALVDVFPDGYCHLVQEGVIRARYRNGDGGPQLLEPNNVYAFDLDLWATAYAFKPGHRVRLEISCSNFTRFDRNLNTGEEPLDQKTPLPARQRVYRSGAYPSALAVTLVKKNSLPD